MFFLIAKDNEWAGLLSSLDMKEIYRIIGL